MKLFEKLFLALLIKQRFPQIVIEARVSVNTGAFVRTDKIIHDITSTLINTFKEEIDAKFIYLVGTNVIFPALLFLSIGILLFRVFCFKK